MKKQTYSRQELRDEFAKEIRFYRAKQDIYRGKRNRLTPDYGFLVTLSSPERRERKAEEAIA